MVHEILVELKRYEIATLPSSGLRAGLSVARNDNVAAGPALRPSAMAQTISEWPRCMSPAVKMPGTLVIQFLSRLSILPSAGNYNPRLGVNVFPSRFATNETLANSLDIDLTDC